jgi:hypothetical protein
MDATQKIFVVSTVADGTYIDISEKDAPTEMDIDEEFKISAIMEIIYDEEDRVFYILTNKFEGKLGFFVIKFKEYDPRGRTFMIKWKNKLDIGDTNIHVLRTDTTKEVVISFKTININTYNLMIMDISQEKSESGKNTIIFRHESFQLWESKITGMLLNRTKDFVTLNRDGINIVALGFEDKRQLVDADGNKRMVHSLDSCNYMKVDPSNYLLFSCARYADRQIQIQQEFNIKKPNQGGQEDFDETDFDQIYNIKVWEITLRELLLF